MKIQFLGTAAAEGIPAMFCECDVCQKSRETGGKNLRSRSQACVDDTLLIDFPGDTYMHVLRDGLPLHKIHSCIITHDHFDHLYAADLENRCTEFAHIHDDKILTFYGTPPAGNKLRVPIIRFNLEKDHRVRMQLIEPFVPFEAEGYRITPLKADHDPYCDPVFYLIEKDGKCVLYSNDTGYYPEETWNYLQQHPCHIDLASFDCTMVIKKCVHGHMGLSTVTEVRDRLKDMGFIDDTTLCYLNHFSHNGGATYDDMVVPAKEHGFSVTYDGLSVEF